MQKKNHIGVLLSVKNLNPIVLGVKIIKFFTSYKAYFKCIAEHNLLIFIKTKVKFFS